MKRKVLTFVLLGVLAVGSIIPVTAQAAETWDYGYNKSTMQWYNFYYNGTYRHYGSITKKGVTYNGPIAIATQWSKLSLDYNGPYKVSYNKHVLR